MSPVGKDPPRADADHDEEPDHFLQLARLASIVESSDDAIISKTLDGRITSWNAGAMRIFGYTAQEAIGQPITLVIPPEYHEEERQILQRLGRGERIEHFETVRQRRDGTRIELSITVSPIRDRSGSIVGASKIARRIDKQVERALAQLAAIVESSDDAIVSKTLDGRIQSWNAAAARIFGYSAEEAIGKSISLIIPPEYQAEERIILEKVGRGERIEHFDTIRQTKDGARIPISLTVSPVRDARGVIIGASKVARDISERKRSELALRETTLALREADRRKDEFIALLAHELRNPLAPIRYALATTKRFERTAQQQRRAEEIIERQVAQMSHLLDDLLDVSRITRGNLELKTSLTDLASVIGTAVETARPLLDAKRHMLTVDLPKQNVRLVADPVRLAQVFSNLLINSAKYTDAGGRVELLAELAGESIIVTVRDNGIGISPEMMPRLFTMFAQDAAAGDRTEGGLGIGLSLVQGIVRLHHGRIEARSEGTGRGSEFVVRIPAHMAADGAAVAHPQVAAPAVDVRLRIVVVDDNRDAADTSSTLLQLSGHDVRTAYTGLGALELIGVQTPDVVLADIGLPDISGYELAERIRALCGSSGPVLVALTGWGQEQDRQQAFGAGFNYHLTKPVAPETIESLLRTVGAVLND